MPPPFAPDSFVCWRNSDDACIAHVAAVLTTEDGLAAYDNREEYSDRAQWPGQGLVPVRTLLSVRYPTLWLAPLPVPPDHPDGHVIGRDWEGNITWIAADRLTAHPSWTA